MNLRYGPGPGPARGLKLLENPGLKLEKIEPDPALLFMSTEKLLNFLKNVLKIAKK